MASRVVGSSTGRRDLWLAVGTATLACAAPLAIGGVHPTTQLVLSAAAFALVGALVLTRRHPAAPDPPLLVAMLAACAVTALQLVPLPPALLRFLSPAAWDIRSDLSSTAWMPMTLDVPATILALVRALACIGVFVVAAAASRHRHIGRIILFTVAMLGGVLALVALGQRLVHADAILGLYRPRSQPGFGFFGTFVDVNHAASIFELGALVAASLALEVRGRARVLLIAAAALAVGALFYTTSRGALLGFAVGSFVLLGTLLVRATGVARGLIAAAVALAIGTATVLTADEALRHHFMPAATSNLWSNQKTRGWRDGLRMAADYRWTGVGRGAFEAPLRAYRDTDEAVRLVYPEDFVVQYAAEWGVPASLLIALLVLGGMRRVLARGHDLGPALVGATAAVVAVVVHELTDFGLEMSGVALPTAAVLGVVAGRAWSRETPMRRLPRAIIIPVAVVWLGALAGGAWALSRTVDADDTRVRAALAAGNADERTFQEVIARHPADDYLELMATERALRAHDAGAMHHLNRALRLHPANWQAHRLAARLLAAVGRRSQAALEYRLAARYGWLSDEKELVRVLGPDVVDAVTQDTPTLLGLVRRLVALGDVPDAMRAGDRAVEVAPHREAALAARTQLALDDLPRPLLLRWSTALAAEATTVESIDLAARGLVKASDNAGALALVSRARKLMPLDPGLSLVTAGVQLAAGDLTGVRATLASPAAQGMTLAQRQHAEELLAEASERAGDVEGAMVARARARMIARQLHQNAMVDSVPR